MLNWQVIECLFVCIIQSVTPKCTSCVRQRWRYVGSGYIENCVLWSTLLFHMTTSSLPVVADRPIENNSFRSKAIFKYRST